MYNRIGNRQGTSGYESFLGTLVGRSVVLHVHGVNFPPTPIEEVDCLLILVGKLCSVPKGHTGGRSRAYVDHGRQGVRIKFWSLAGSVPPAIHRTACDVTDPGGPVPWGVDIVFHVSVVGEELAIQIESTVENVTVAR